MIDKDIFAANMGILAGAFGRVVDSAVVLAYYRVLSPKLTTPEFEQAVRIVVERETFWPSPAVLLNAIRPKDEAEAALERVIDWLRDSGGFLHISAEEFQAFPPEVKAGIKAAGGLRAIDLCSVEQLPKLERRFVEAFTEVRHPLLIEGSRDKALPRRDRTTGNGLESSGSVVDRVMKGLSP